jgi:hypothetical protein
MNSSQILWCLFIGIFFTSTTFAAGQKSTPGGTICVVCILATPGEKTIRELEVLNESVAEVLERLVKKDNRIKLLRAALLDEQNQAQKLLDLCKKEKSKILNKFKNDDELPKCRAYIDTAPWERSIEKAINYHSLLLVQEKLLEAKTLREKVDKRLINSGISVTKVNSDPEHKASQRLIAELSDEKDKLDSENKRMNEKVLPSAKSSTEESRNGFLEQLGFGKEYPMHCFAKLDSDTAKEIGCPVR